MRVLAIASLALTITAAQAPPKQARQAYDAASKAAGVKNTVEAIRLYEKAVALYPGYAEAWCELGKLQIQENQPDAARKSLEAAISADPKSAGAYMHLATLEYTAKNWSAVVDVTGRLVKLNPAGYPQAYLFNAVAQYNSRDLEAAEKSAREAQRVDPLHKVPISWQLLGRILAARGELLDAHAGTSHN